MAFLFPIWWWQWLLDKKQPPAPTPTPGRPRVFRWAHRDRDMDSASYEALTTAMRGNWASLDPKTRVRQFRAFVLLSLRVATLSPNAVELGDLRADIYSDQERNAAGAVLARTLVLLSPRGMRAVADMQTEEGKPPTGKGVSETGEPISALIVVILALASVAAVWLGAQAAVRVNFDDEATKRLLQTQAKAIEILTLHVERERAVGRQLPFDEEERTFLVKLEDQQKDLATLQSRPLPSPFEGAATFTREAGNAAGSLATLALVLVGAYFFLKSERRSQSSRRIELVD